MSIALRLSRSKASPLDVCLDLRDPEWDWEYDFDESSHVFTVEDMDILLSILVPHASRWRTCELLSDTWAPIHAFLSRTQSVALPILEKLSLARCNVSPI